MAQATVPVPVVRNPAPLSYAVKNEASSSGASWAAIGGGAFASAALLLSLSELGTGMGLSSLSPWSNSGLSTSSVGMGALLYLCIAEIIACALGGYVAGRLRTKWVDVHSDEVYFRDTAHGFLVWAVSFVVVAAFLVLTGALLSGTENRAGSGAHADGMTEASRYYVDSLFRSAQPTSAPDDATRAEVAAVFNHALRQRQLASEDKSYVSSMVAAKTGLSPAEAETRVSQVFSRDQEAVDTARKALAHSLYWMFLASLLGAFSASLAATFGGKQRDKVVMNRAL
jgi:hypothetical protein